MKKKYIVAGILAAQGLSARQSASTCILIKRMQEMNMKN